MDYAHAVPSIREKEKALSDQSSFVKRKQRHNWNERGGKTKGKKKKDMYPHEE